MASKGKGKGPPPPANAKLPPPQAAGYIKRKEETPEEIEARVKRDYDRLDANKQAKDENESLEIEDVDMNQIDESVTLERVKCPRCEKLVLAAYYKEHLDAHSSQIFPWLFLGGNRNAENAKELSVRTGITHMLNVAHECNFWDDVRDEVVPYNEERGLGFTYKKIAMVDKGEQDLLEHLPEALEFIHEAHIERPEHHVLVHCVQGISRSASVVIAYLIQHEGMSLREAYELVKKARPIADPRKNFLDQLGILECRVRGLERPTLTGDEIFAGRELLNVD